MPEKLTPKQEAFVREYLLDRNATQAAIRAGYSEKTARVTGPENLSKPAVAARLAEHEKKVSDEFDVTIQEIVKGLHKEATREGEDSKHAARVSAWGLLGKFKGMFNEPPAPINVTMPVLVIGDPRGWEGAAKQHEEIPEIKAKMLPPLPKAKKTEGKRAKVDLSL